MLLQNTVEFYGVRHFYRAVLSGAWTQLHQTWRWHRSIMATQEVYFTVQISCCIFKRGRLKDEWFASDVENNAKFFTFWPPVKIRGGWARSLYQLQCACENVIFWFLFLVYKLYFCGRRVGVVWSKTSWDAWSFIPACKHDVWTSMCLDANCLLIRITTSNVAVVILTFFTAVFSWPARSGAAPCRPGINHYLIDRLVDWLVALGWWWRWCGKPRPSCLAATVYQL